jgi:hypothetical protein
MSPAKRVRGQRTRSKCGNFADVSYSKALEISITRSARKLKRTTASPSWIAPTGLSSASTMTKGSSHWSEIVSFCVVVGWGGWWGGVGWVGWWFRMVMV